MHIYTYYDITGEFHQYDFFVYPRETKIPKGILNSVFEGGKGLLNYFKKKVTKEDSTDVELNPVNIDDMTKQCLDFYLNSHWLKYMDKKHWTGIKLDCFVQHMSIIYFQHHNPSLMRNKLGKCEPVGAIVMVSWDCHMHWSMIHVTFPCYNL